MADTTIKLVTRQSIADLLGATEFSTSASYTAGDKVLYGNKAYKFTTAHSGAWAAADVEEFVLDMDAKLDSLGQASEFATETAYAAGVLVRHGSALYRCKSAVAADNTLAPPDDTAHWEAFKLSTDAMTIVKLADGSETMASVLAKLNAVNTQGQHVLFDTSAISADPPLYLCTIYIDTDDGVVRVSDVVTGKIYLGVYDAAQTVLQVLQSAVDAYVTIIVTAQTQDDVTVTGQTVSLYEGVDAATGTLREQKAYDGQPVSFLVPKGFQYFVQISSTLSGHFSPSTAQGNANATTYLTLTYQDASSITDLAGLKGFIRQEGMTQEIARQALFTVDGEGFMHGREFADTWIADDGVTGIDNPWVVMDVKTYRDAEDVEFLGVKVRRKYATQDMQFDAPETPVLCDSSEETTAQAGLGYYGWAKAFDATKAYSVNSYCSYNGVAYKCIVALAAGEATDTPDVDTTHFTVQTDMVKSSLVWLGLSTGVALPYSDYLAVYKHGYAYNARDAFSYGSNRYDQSAACQYLDSSAGVGEWWSAQHIGDVAPSQASTTRGYMAGCSAAILAAARPVKVQCYSGQAGIVTTTNTFFLDSGNEMNGVVNDNEGTYDLYWYEAMGKVSATNSANTGRITRRQTAKTSACSLWLRSPNRGNVSVVWLVNTSGTINGGGNASNSFGLAPACVIG